MDDTDHKDFEEKPIEKQSMFWVGIGASAGGLEALRALVRKLPSDLNATYIVAQHLSPHHRSMFPEIIGRETDFEVLSVSDSVRPKPNKIYITPQNKDIEIVGDQLKLMSPSQEAASPKPSVDRFFRSLAREKGNAAVAIVLSGTGSDGSRGVREVRAEGGIVIAQDDLTAKYSGMPVAAVESGAVDIVMSPEEIGAQFGMILERRRDLASLKDTPVHLDGVSELIHLVHNQTRVNFRYYKAATLQRRIERRMAAIGVSEIEDYVSIARTSPKEVDALFRDFLISVTSFFRDPAEFDSLRTFIREIIDQKPDHEPIRVWVPGAATGEEVYSIAMLFADELGGIDQFSRRKVQLFATDIDRDGIEQARRAFYSEPLLDAIPANFVPEYFDKVPTGYVVKKAIRERVIYSVHDVTKDPPFLKIDLVACRNLLIYFQSSLQAQVLARLHYAMVNQGILFLGKSETTSAAENLFRAADQERHIFYKRAVRNNLLSTEPSAFQTPTRKSPEQAGTRSADVRELTEANARFDSLVASIGPDGFLVGADLHLKRAYGNVNPYIEVGSGDLTLGISNLLKEPYGQDIRSAVPIVIRKKTTRRGIAHRDEEDPTKRTRVSVYPIDSGPDSDVLALAIIHSWHEDTEEGERDQTLESSDIVKQNDELRRELAIAQTNLQQTSEELETSNEELQALNEELQSSNEELQSTNEELETSNEELQSTNEELSTVNEELQVSSHELRLLNESLKSILLNIGSPLIVVDRNLNIVHISRASETLFQIDPQLELPHLSTIKRNVGFPDIAELANEAINKNIRVDRQVKTATMDAMVSVVPNVTEFQKVSGAIILVTDNTSELKKTRDELQLIFDNIPQGIFVRKQNGALIKSNPAGRTLLGADEAAIENTNFLDFFAGETADDLKAQDEQIAESGEAVIDRVGRFAFKDGRMTWIRYSQLIVDDEENDDRLNYLLAQDISAEHEAQIALTTSEERLGLAVDAAKIGLWDLDIQNDNLWWSDTFKSIVGLDEATFSGKDDAFYSRLHPEDTQRVRDAVDAHLNGKAPYDLRYRLEKKDGDYVWIEARGQASFDEDGEPKRFTGTIVDITDRLQTEIQIDENRSQLEQAARLAGLGYWKIDLLDETLYWSDRVYEVHGVDPTAVQPTVETAINFYHPDDREMVSDLVQNAVENAQSFQFEARIVRSDGGVRVTRSIGTVTVDGGGNSTSVFGVFMDVTEDRQRESDLKITLGELAKSNEELNRFSYVCSHDLKEPVRLIESMTSLLLDPEASIDEAERDELIGRIGKNTSRLGNIINGLLAYSRIDEQIAYDRIDMDRLLAEVVEATSLAVADSGADVTLGPLPDLYGARVHFQQLFQNLIVNALKFNDKDTPVIRVTGKKTGRALTYTVEDNGPGIPDKQRDEVFEVFRRLQLQQDIEGVGLGLSICQRIAQQYGGGIEIKDSKTLGGASFVVSIPAERALENG